MSSTTPLTDSIDNLTTYANSVTGASDTNLSDAVATLASGYGGGGGSGEWTTDGIATNNEPSGDIVLGEGVTVIGQYAFANKPITSIYAKNVTQIQGTAFNGCKALVTASFPNLQNTVNQSTGYQFQGSTVKYIYAPKFTDAIPTNFAQGANQLEVIDLGSASTIGARAFSDCSKLDTIILRKETGLTSLANTNSIANSTPFKSGGAGGTVYIPETLYNHLGDGSSLDYQSATNWSTIYGYGTITWAKLEGSAYENPVT